MQLATPWLCRAVAFSFPSSLLRTLRSRCVPTLYLRQQSDPPVGYTPPYFTEPTARRYNKVLRMGLQESEKISENFRN